MQYQRFCILLIFNTLGNDCEDIPKEACQGRTVIAVTVQFFRSNYTPTLPHARKKHTYLHIVILLSGKTQKCQITLSEAQ